jgi:hypothetical protein
MEFDIVSKKVYGHEPGSWFQRTDYYLKNPCPEIALETEGKTVNKLYEITTAAGKLYGHKLAVNSQGHWVMEVKGTGTVLAVDKSNVEEVMPHTISVQFDSSKQAYAYLAEAGKYKVGEFYILDAPYGRSIVQVIAVDTKNVQATKQFEPLAKLVTE